MQIEEAIKKLRQLSLPHTEIVSVSYEDQGCFEMEDGGRLTDLPPCFRAVLHARPGAGSFIRTEVWLPEEWNGIFLGLGNGGMAGGFDYWGLAHNMKKGYAAANTDMGTSRGRESGIANPDVWKDFGWRATHEMTVSAKALLQALYGRDAAFSYFWGASTGGQQGLAEAQRFPDDYDGIFCGVPANNRTQLHTYFLWNHIHLRTADGTPLFTHAEVQAVTDCAVRYYQARGDGQPGDNFVTLPQMEPAVIDGFLEFLRDGCPSLRPEQLAALRAVYYGPVNPADGRRIYNGMPIGSEIYGCGIEDCQQAESPHYYPFIWAFGADYDGRTFDFDKDLDRLNADLAADLNANSPELSAFAANGGKLLLYSGSADPCVPFPDAMRYYDRITAAMGGIEAVKGFCRYFLMPGREHGQMGAGTNAVWQDESGGDELTALRRWREEGIAPDTLTAVGYKDADPEKGVRFTRQVPYYVPQAAPRGEGAPLLVCDPSYLGE